MMSNDQTTENDEHDKKSHSLLASADWAKPTSNIAHNSNTS